MLTKRIIPCLDIKNGRTVKGINFLGLRDAGDPIELARMYSDNGADELVFLDISATNEKRGTLTELVKAVGKVINIPFSVGGGVSSVEDANLLLKNGAEKVCINSSAVRNPNLIAEISDAFGSQCLVVAIDAKFIHDQWLVHTHGGSKSSDWELYAWAKQAETLGAGEILFTSMDHDGTKNGFAVEEIGKMNETLSIPVIASGGAGAKSHFKEVFQKGKADAALAASIFHFNEIPIVELKLYLQAEGIEMRV